MSPVAVTVHRVAILDRIQGIKVGSLVVPDLCTQVDESDQGVQSEVKGRRRTKFHPVTTLQPRPKHPPRAGWL